MEKHSLDRLFAEKLAGFEDTPSQKAWEMLSENLDNKRRSNIRVWLSMAVAAALVLTSAYLLVPTDPVEPGDNYVSNNPDIAPEVPVFEARLPVFITRESPAREVVAVTQTTTKSFEQAEPVVTQTLPIIKKENLQIKNQKNNSHLGPIMDSELIKMTPVLVAEQTADANLGQQVAGNQPPVLASTEHINQPVTIIYKQGEAEEKSRFAKALNFVDEVRKGERKLIDINKIDVNKIKSGLFTRNKEQVNNSK